MSLSRRMSAIVGDQNTVARYLLEKCGHTAFITLALTCVAHVPPVLAATLAVLLYLVVGKILWHVCNGWRLGIDDVKDFVFDGLVGSLVIVLTLFTIAAWAGATAFVAWLIVFLILDNNAWGSPS